MTSGDQRHDRAERLLRRLHMAHAVLKHYRPLDEQGIAAQLIAAHPQEEPWLLRLALHLHLASDTYLQALSHGGSRYGLDGAPAGEVDPETRHHAHALLKHHRLHHHKQEE